MKHQKLGQSTGFVTASIEFVLSAALRDPESAQAYSIARSTIALPHDPFRFT